jgi:hypothetical protein
MSEQPTPQKHPRGLERAASACVLLVLASCRHENADPRATAASVDATTAGDAGACGATSSPCERIDERQRAGIRSIGASSASTSSVFRRCVFAEGGAVGLVPERGARGESGAFRVVFEPHAGPAIVSERHDYDLAARGEQAADPPEDALVFPTAGANAAPVVFVKFRARIRPSPLGAAVPAQAAEFFSKISAAPGSDAGRSTKSAASWTELEAVDAGAYRLGFRLPGLVWQEGRAYGGSTERELRGVDAFVFLDGTFDLAAKQDLRGAVKHACASAPPPDRASPAQLWTAAQCQRVRGEPIATILERVARRCDALARQALPLSLALSSMSARERDGHANAPAIVEETSEKLARVNPPSACFTDHLWNVDYTARARPLVLPRVELDPAWNEGLAALGEWPSPPR